jgi:hypothetical protein
LRGENDERPPLTASEIEVIRSQVIGFVSDRSMDAALHCGGIKIKLKLANPSSIQENYQFIIIYIYGQNCVLSILVVLLILAMTIILFSFLRT